MKQQKNLKRWTIFFFVNF